MPERQGLLALTGTVAPLLTVPTQSLEAVDQHSLWMPRLWKKTTPFVIDDVINQPITPQTIGNEMIFDIPKQAHLIKTMLLHVVLAPRVVAPLGTAQYVDHLGFALVENFKIMFGANLCYEVQPHDLYFKYRKTFQNEKRDAINEMILGDMTSAQLTSALANGVEMFIPLFLPFEEHQNKSLPLLVLSQKLRIIFKCQTLANLTHVQAGSTVTINGQDTFELILKEVHLTGSEAEKILAMSRDSRGISYMIHQHVRQNSDDFASTQNGFQIQCRMVGITKPIKAMYMALIPTKLLNNTGRNDMFFFQSNPNPGPVPAGMTAYARPVSYQINANGNIIQRVIPFRYDTIYNHYHYYNSQHGEDIMNQIYSEYPISFSSATGYNDYTNHSNPVITITMGTGGTGLDFDNALVAQSLRLLINGLDFNFWYFQNGNMTRTFN